MEDRRWPIPKALATNAHITSQNYLQLKQQAIDEPEQFWAQQAEEFLSWSKPWQTVLTGGFDKVDFRWFDGGELNVSVNCIDRHLPQRANQTAIIWEGDDPHQSHHITYQALHDQVCQLANALKNHGVKKGDRICIYMPMIPEAAFAMLACARIGAIHSVVFGGFSADALRDRIQDAECSIVITADEAIRGGKPVPLKQQVDIALQDQHSVNKVIVCKHSGTEIDWHPGRDNWYHEITVNESSHCEPTAMKAEDPLFILYTSGSTGQPKGVLHTTAGYLLYAAMTHKYVFDYHDDDIYWCNADIGWITGHSYIVYGPLVNGATTLIFAGVPNYPDASRFWRVIDKHQVTLFYTAPTAIRALMREGDDWVKQCQRSSLQLLGTVGEPINPEVWEWYHHVVGADRCPIVDTWWQTETGGILISPLAGVTELKPGSTSHSLFGIQAQILDDNGKPVPNNHKGKLVISQPWPGQARTVYGDHQRFIDTYFKTFPGFYDTGDGARCDSDGYFWITGRVDDVINVSGHRLGTAEIENALLEDHEVAEAAVVGISHEIKGQAIVAYVTLKKKITGNQDTKQRLINIVRERIGPIATPDTITFTDALPKTRSGKVMRRILRKIACGNTEDLGDTSTLADPTVIIKLLKKG